jgi:hypothetical protein
VKPIVKKIAAAVAIKEGVEKLQEMRKPKKPSFLQRLMPFALIGAIVGLGFFVYKNKMNGDSTASYDVDPPRTASASGGNF